MWSWMGSLEIGSLEIGVLEIGSLEKGNLGGPITPAASLFFAEAIEPHHLGALAGLFRLRDFLVRRHRQSGRGRRSRGLVFIGGRHGIGGLELQTELHRGIEEALDGAKGNDEPLRDAAKRQADLEAF